MAAPAIAAGLLVAASVPPWGFWALGFAGLGFVAWRLQHLRLRARMAAGLCFGLGLFAPTLFWITEFHAVGFGALLLLEASFFAAACAVVPAATRAAGPVGSFGPPTPLRGPLGPTLLALPGALVLAEMARGAVPFGGLPMAGIPLGQAGGPLAPAARLGGPLLVTALAGVAGSAVAAAAARRWKAAGALGAVVVALASAGLAAPDGHPRQRLDVAVVQGGGERGFRAVESDPTSVLQAHLAVSANLSPSLDLVLWPENTIDVASLPDTEEAAALAAIAQRLQATVVAGVTEDVGELNFQNVAVAWSPAGDIVDRYVKTKRVPFGEYVPLRGLLEGFVDLSVLPRDAVAGRGPGLLRTPAGNLGVAISFEVFFASRGREAVRAGGEILLVPTNAASFTSSQVPTQEVAASQLQAWATGRWVVQSAPTGYGAIIDPEGHVVGRTTLGRAQILRGRPELRSGRTPYVVAGDAPTVSVTGGQGTLRAERVGGLTDRVLATLATAVQEFGGHVDKLTGDGLMAVFGAPTAHEDDPERAVRAAARMQSAVRRVVEEESGGGRRLGLRVGLNTGEVLAGIQAHLSYTVVGDTVNTAARLSDAAGVGAVLAGRDT
ncbi:MAG: apolipoprotein N-acyltransferase, partial [Actinobacteria bacterium]|nr:apolipoprotein N-acyltransferase [Actinomycetota bacterium]